MSSGGGHTSKKTQYESISYYEDWPGTSLQVEGLRISTPHLHCPIHIHTLPNTVRGYIEHLIQCLVHLTQTSSQALSLNTPPAQKALRTTHSTVHNSNTHLPPLPNSPTQMRPLNTPTPRLHNPHIYTIQLKTTVRNPTPPYSPV